VSFLKKTTLVVMVLRGVSQVEHCKQPGLAVTLTLRHSRQTVSGTSDVSRLVAFVSGLLLDNDANVRNWFAQFIRPSLKVYKIYSHYVFRNY